MCLGTKLGDVVPFRKRHTSISFLLGGLVGCKMLLKAGKAEMSTCTSRDRDPEGTLGTIWGSFCYVFGHEIKWCLAASQASQRHIISAWRACWVQDVAES